MTRPYSHPMKPPNIRTPLFSRHERTWRKNHYVYPVISRRSGGLSIGINLSLNKGCTFDCAYCCVDRTRPASRRAIYMELLEAELDEMLSLATSGELFKEQPFDQTPAELRRLNDIAFSGDGEPTLFTRLPMAIEMVARLLAKHHLADARIILITNATLLDRPTVQESLALVAQHKGEIWAKLDAGTQEYYQLIDRSPVPLLRVLRCLRHAAVTYGIVVQSMFLRYQGSGPTDQEIEAYVGRLREIIAAGGTIRHVQVYTVARPPADRDVDMLDDASLDAIATKVRAAGILAEVFYGSPTDRR